MTAATPTLPDEPALLKAMLLAERAESERLRQIIKELQRHRFCRRAETLPEDQLLLALEEVEQGDAAGAAQSEATAPDQRVGPRSPAPGEPGRAAGSSAAARECGRHRQSALSLLLRPPAPDRRGCRGAPRHRAGAVPGAGGARPKYACRSCEDVVLQTPAPARLIEGGLPTDATVAQVLVSRYADHLPLYRQAQIYARQGVRLDRSTLADWVGRAAFLLRPVHERLPQKLTASTKLFADETTAPVLDPGRGRTKIGQLFAYARHDRPWGGTDPPGVAYVYAPDRTAARPIAHLASVVARPARSCSCLDSRKRLFQ